VRKLIHLPNTLQPHCLVEVKHKMTKAVSAASSGKALAKKTEKRMHLVCRRRNNNDKTMLIQSATSCQSQQSTSAWQS